MLKGTYVGANETLKGKTALLMEARHARPTVENGFGSECFSAQFDDVGTGFGYGWHIFMKTDFQIDKEIGLDAPDV